jgi:hypothetical protein
MAWYKGVEVLIFFVFHLVSQKEIGVVLDLMEKNV